MNMKKSVLFYIWGGAYLVCALLSLVAKPSAPLQVVRTILSFLFFLPPLLLRLQKEENTNRILFWISLGSVVLTFLTLLLNIVTFAAPAWVGVLLYYVLLFLSVPAICCGSYALSLFLWVCLMYACLPKRKKKGSQ